MYLSGTSSKGIVDIDEICFSQALGSGMRREQGIIQKLDREWRIKWHLWMDEAAAMLVQERWER